MIKNPKLQRFTAMSVSALLAANVLVLVLGFGDEPAAEPATITYIVAEDGSRVAVDPSTPEGARAIADAQERGHSVVTVPSEDAPASAVTPGSESAPGSSTTTPGAQLPVAPAGGGITVPTVPGLPDDAGAVIDDTLTTIADTVGDVGDAVDGAVDDATDLVDDTAGTDTGEIVDPIVDDGTDTVDETVTTIVDTVTETTPEVPLPDAPDNPLPLGDVEDVGEDLPDLPGL